MGEIDTSGISRFWLLRHEEVSWAERKHSPGPLSDPEFNNDCEITVRHTRKPAVSIIGMELKRAHLP